MSDNPRISSHDVGLFALEFLDDLDDVRDEDHYMAIILVAGLDEDGDIVVRMRTSDSNSLPIIRVLQEAQLLETRTAIEDAGDDA